MKKSCEVEGTHGKVEKEEKEEVDEEVFRLLDLPEELLEVLGKYLDVATTLALASTCSLLQARQKYNHFNKKKPFNVSSTFSEHRKLFSFTGVKTKTSSLFLPKWFSFTIDTLTKFHHNSNCTRDQGFGALC